MLSVASIVVFAVSLLPFASEKETYVSGTLDQKLWQEYRERFIKDGRVVDRHQDGISHSEGQGYAMLMAVAADDRASFDQLWEWTRSVLQRKDDLFSWRYEECPERDAGCVADYNNASDGDVLIAWALLRAHRRWDESDYNRHARRITDAIAEHLLVSHQQRLILLPGIEGFADEDTLTLNPSYWIFPALEAFSAEFDEPLWDDVIASGRWLLHQGRFGVHQLPPDWVVLEDGALRLSDKFPPRYSYNAVRIALHQAWSAHGISSVELIPYESFWSQAPSPPAWIDLVDGGTAEFSWNTGMKAIAEFARLRAEPQAGEVVLPLPAKDEGYYSWSLTLLSHIAAGETLR
ncbi:MAG: glycosyl hydrolase family 8 [Pseudomonadota bacterium]